MKIEYIDTAKGMSNTLYTTIPSKLNEGIIEKGDTIRVTVEKIEGGTPK